MSASNYQDRVKGVIRQFDLGCLPKRETVAEKMHVSSRTLARRLSRENTTFKKLVDEYLKIKSLPYVSNDRYSISDVSELIGYSDAASFVSAFSRWTGKTPSSFRKSIGLDG